MTGKAFRVIKGGLPHHGLMRVVTGGTSNAAIVRGIAAAAGQAVALKAYILDAMNPEKLFGENGAMAGAAKVIEGLGTQRSRIEDAKSLNMTALNGRDMVGSGTVATFTTNPGDHLAELKLVVTHGGRCVASEAEPLIAPSQPDAERALQKLGSCVLMSRRNVQTVNRVVIGDFAFKQKALIFEYVSLANGAKTITEGRENRDHDGALSIRN